MGNIDKFFEVFVFERPEITNVRDLFEVNSNKWRIIVDNQQAYDGYIDSVSAENIQANDPTFEVIQDVIDFVNTSLLDNDLIIPILDFDGQNVFVSLLNILETGTTFMELPNGSDRFYLSKWKAIEEDVEHVDLDMSNHSAQVKLKQVEIAINHFMESIETEVIDGVPTLTLDKVESLEDITQAVGSIFNEMDKADEFYDFYETTLKQIFLTQDDKTLDYVERIVNKEYKEFIEGLNNLVADIEL